MPSPTLRLKRGAYSALPGLQSGEPGFTTDKYDLFIGYDGTSLGNKFFGSARNWIRETGSTGGGIKIHEGTSNGNSGIVLKAPDSIDGNQTYTLPVDPVEGYYLKTNSSGELIWSNVFQELQSQNLYAGIGTFTGNVAITTGTPSTGSTTGALVVAGGVGIGSDLNIGNNLYVAGVSTFIGTATFQGGTINLGDSNTDNINVVGEFISNLTPNVNGAYDVGIGTQQWRDAFFTGIGSFASGTLSSNIDVGVSDPNTITTVAGPLTIDSSDNYVEINSNLSVAGVTTFGTTPSDIFTVNGSSVFNNTVDIAGNVFVGAGTTVQIDSDNVNIKDRLLNVGLGTTAPTDSTWDVGVLFNYYKSNQNKRSGIFWNDSEGRIGIASHIGVINNEFGTLDSQPEVDTTSVIWAPIEVGALWVTDCAGTSQVITCMDGERLLENISIDCGVF